MLLAILILWSSLPSANSEGAFRFWQTDIPPNVGSGIGFTSDGKLFFGNCQIYDPVVRKIESKRRYPKELCDPRRVKFSSVSPDGSMLLVSVTGSAPSCSGLSLRIDGRSGSIRGRSKGVSFSNIAIHPNNLQYARIESRDIKASERTVGEPEQYQVVAIRNMSRSLIAESPPMGVTGISSLLYIGDGSSIEVEGHVYSTSDWREKVGEESPYFEYCSSDGSSCVRIQEGSNTTIHSRRNSQPIPIPNHFYLLSEGREFSWSQDGRFFAFKGISRQESGASVMRMGVIDLDPTDRVAP